MAHGKILAMLDSKVRYENRVKKYFFVNWRSYAVEDKFEGKQGTFIKLVKKRLNFEAQAFYMWLD